MREILFKAKMTGCNGKWIVGDYSAETLREYPCIREVGSDIYTVINPETLCQYIGKCDKNGNKIFENDVIQYQLVDDDGTVNIEKFVIKYNVEETRFEQVPIKKCISDGWIDSSCEVIGNIFDKE